MEVIVYEGYKDRGKPSNMSGGGEHIDQKLLNSAAQLQAERGEVVK